MNGGGVATGPGPFGAGIVAGQRGPNRVLEGASHRARGGDTRSAGLRRGRR
jgi:hypothetical protein